MLRCSLLLAFVLLTVQQAAAQKAYPPKFENAETHAYKQAGDVPLNLWVFKPSKSGATDESTVDAKAKPAIVFFFGGAWRTGSPQQFERQCRYFASRGMVAIAADYRVASRHGVPVVECVRDAKSAIRWVREHADELGVDPQRIVAAGGSAGGHLAACTALLSEFDEAGENAAVSSRPAALVLFNPVLSLTAQAPRDRARRVNRLAQQLGAKREQLSPADHVTAQSPPTLVLIGTEDYLRDGVEQFATNMEQAGRRCEVEWFEGREHGFFNFERSREDFLATLEEADRFLESLGYIEGQPTVDDYFENVTPQ